MEVIEQYCQTLSGLQKNCSVILDEIYVKPSIQLRANHFIGKALDNTSQCARTILAVMLKPAMKGKPLIISLIPIYKLSLDFLYEKIMEILKILHQCGISVINLMSDNHPTNQSLFSKMTSTYPVTPHVNYKCKDPNDANREIYLLYDPVHLLKNIRNNWYTEKDKTLHIYLPGSQMPNGITYKVFLKRRKTILLDELRLQKPLSILPQLTDKKSA